MGHYHVNIMSELTPQPSAAPSPSARRKAMADWFMETSSLVVVFMVFEPAMKLARQDDVAPHYTLPLWYYLVVLASALGCFLLGMRLHHEP
jgi:hypothetical protein